MWCDIDQGWAHEPNVWFEGDRDFFFSVVDRLTEQLPPARPIQRAAKAVARYRECRVKACTFERISAVLDRLGGDGWDCPACRGRVDGTNRDRRRQ